MAQDHDISVASPSIIKKTIKPAFRETFVSNSFDGYEYDTIPGECSIH